MSELDLFDQNLRGVLPTWTVEQLWVVLYRLGAELRSRGVPAGHLVDEAALNFGQWLRYRPRTTAHGVGE